MLSAEDRGVPPQEGVEIKNVAIAKGVVKDGKAVFYTVQVLGSFNSWTCLKRYSQFEALQADVFAQFSAILVPGTELPPKKLKLFTDHNSPSFIEERRVLLESFLLKLVSVPEIASSDILIGFLTSDKETGDAPVIVDRKKQIEDELPDDVEVTGISIPATRTMSDHILYQIDAENARKRKSFSRWTVLKRFGQFYEMDQALRTAFQSDPMFLDLLPAPPARKAKLLNDHMDVGFIEQRRVLLENYMNQLLKHERVVRNEQFLEFIGAAN